MVNVDTTLKSSMDSVFTPRIIPKNAKTESEIGGTSTSSPEATSTRDAAADFRALFTSHSNPPDPAASANTLNVVIPTAQSVFGSTPWMANPGGIATLNGLHYSYNPEYFATRATADKLAQMYGGTVQEMDAITPFGPYKQDQMNEMIRFPNGNVVNAGILATYFDRGLTQAQIDSAIAGEIRQIPG